MTENKTEPIAAVLVDEIVGDGVPPGAIKFYATPKGDPAGFHFRCPCGCGRVGAVSVMPTGWRWNGSRDKPTVHPSVRLDGAHWHGWLTEGVWWSA